MRKSDRKKSFPRMATTGVTEMGENKVDVKKAVEGMVGVPDRNASLLAIRKRMKCDNHLPASKQKNAPSLRNTPMERSRSTLGEKTHQKVLKGCGGNQ